MPVGILVPAARVATLFFFLSSFAAYQWVVVDKGMLAERIQVSKVGKMIWRCVDRLARVGGPDKGGHSSQMCLLPIRRDWHPLNPSKHMA